MYRLTFDPRALKEFEKLGAPIKRQFQKKLSERLESPRAASDALSGMKDCYKIKLRSAGYRLIYQVQDDVVCVFVIAVGPRDSGKDDAYDRARRRVK